MLFSTFSELDAHGDCFQMIFHPDKQYTAILETGKILGVWEKMNEILRKLWRVKIGRKENPSAAIIDSQSLTLRTDT